MASARTRFPTWPIRDVSVRNDRAGVCSMFAAATVDFEPMTPPGTGCVLTLPSNPTFDYGIAGSQAERLEFGTIRECLDGFVDGIREELTRRPELVPATEVVLRSAVIHVVDSNGLSFRAAGRLIAKAALERFAGEG